MNRAKFLSKLSILLLLLIGVIGMQSFTSCSSGKDDDGNDINLSSSGTSTSDLPSSSSLVPPLALRAEPVSAVATGSQPKILDSWTEGDKNWYIIDVGYVNNTYISQIAYVHYIGFPMQYSKTTTTEIASTISNSMTETVSNSVTVSDASKTNVSLEAAIKAKFLNFSVKYGHETLNTVSVSDGKSTTTSESSILSTAEKEAETINFTIGNNGEVIGHYRYALYAVIDVYFIVSTSLEDQELLSWEVISGTRNLAPKWDYSPDGKFDNSPVGEKINLTDDFWKTLPKPSKIIYPQKREIIIESFTSNSNYTLPNNLKFPAEIEIYALGAGGGGQGGHRNNAGILPDTYSGTGGSGGGGTAVYRKFTVTVPVSFNIIIGSGGGGGSGKHTPWGNDGGWDSGDPGWNGGNTSVTWGTSTITAQGGVGGGGGDTGGHRVLTGGAGGASSNAESENNFGSNGSNGVQDGDARSAGGNSGSINIGSVVPFGGGSGAVRPTGQRVTQQAGKGGGGAGEHSDNRSGSRGGDGHVIIVVTWYE